MPFYNKTYREVDGVVIPGTFLQAFIHNGPYYFVVEIKIYKDGLIDCWKKVDIEGFKECVSQGWVRTQLPQGARVSMMNDVFFNVTDVKGGVLEEEFVKEIEDELRRLNGQPTTRQICVDAMETYRQAPTREAREKLRQAYYAVPQHLRMFLGDMDEKDREYKRVLGFT